MPDAAADARHLEPPDRLHSNAPARATDARFTVRLLGQPPIVMISDPDDIKEIFRRRPRCCTPARAPRSSNRSSGANSVILLDEAPHLEQRKLLLPAFHGERMQRLAG